MRSNNTLSKNINRLRNAKNWSQQQLADFAGVSLQTIFRAESKNTVPRGNNLRKIAAALGVTESDLYSEADQIKNFATAPGKAESTLALIATLSSLNEAEVNDLLALANGFLTRRGMNTKKITG